MAFSNVNDFTGSAVIKNGAQAGAMVYTPTPDEGLHDLYRRRGPQGADTLRT